MVAGLAPGVLAFNQMLAMAAEQKAKDAAVKIYELAVHKGSIQPDENSFGAMINCAWVRQLPLRLRASWGARL